MTNDPLVDRLTSLTTNGLLLEPTRAAAGVLGASLAAAQGEAGRGGGGLDVDVAGILAVEHASLELENGVHVPEIIRDVLVFAPVALTWYHLHGAFSNYAAYANRVAMSNDEIAAANAKANSAAAIKPLEGTKSFLVAWQDGLAGSTRLADVALRVVALVALVMALTMWIWWSRRNRTQYRNLVISQAAETMTTAQMRIIEARAAVSDHEHETAEETTARRTEAILTSLHELNASFDQTGTSLAGALGLLQSASTSMADAAAKLDADVDQLRLASQRLVERTTSTEELAEIRRLNAELRQQTTDVTLNAASTVTSLNDLSTELLEVRRREAVRERDVLTALQEITNWLDAAERVASYFRTLASVLPEAGLIPPAVSATRPVVTPASPVATMPAPAAVAVDDEVDPRPRAASRRRRATNRRPPGASGRPAEERDAN